MDIFFYTSSAEPNSFPKVLGSAIRYQGELRDECDILNPVLTIEGLNPDTTFNYCYIPDFKRYYFIRESSVVRTGLIQFNLHVDVLQSWSKEILELEAIISRNEYDFNNHLEDTRVPAWSNNMTSYKEPTNITGNLSMPNLSNELYNIVLTVANKVVGV